MLPAFLIDLSVCLFSEPANSWFCQARKKLLAASYRKKSLLLLAPSLLTKNQFMQNQHNVIVGFFLDQGMKRRLKKEYWNSCFSVYLPYTGATEVYGAECHKFQYATCYQINDVYGAELKCSVAEFFPHLCCSGGRKTSE